MVSSERTAFVWSLSIFILAIGVASNDTIGLSTNQISTEGLSVNETTKAGDVLSGKLSQSIVNTCTFSGQCQNGGSCVYEDGMNHCQCKNGTSGDHCGIVDECESNSTKCGIEPDVQCIYNISKEVAECKCSDSSKGFDSKKKKCRVPCKTSSDCRKYIVCKKNPDNNLKFCKCPFGTGGDKCNEKVDECKAVGLDCGINPNVTCLENRTGDAVCYCEPWSHGFNYEVKDCVECNCEGSNLGCQFFPGGEKQCYCQTNFYQKDGKCLACDCGFGSDGCKLENGTKVCNCWRGYLQNNDTCEECDCGKNSYGCSFENGQKTCSCKWDYTEFNGTCKETCFEFSILDKCKNGGKCEDSVCQCLPGTHGDRCEIIDECELSWELLYKCGESDGVECLFNETSLETYCGCKQKGYLFDHFYEWKCKECDCGRHGNCSFIRGMKTCKCEKGYEVNPADWYSTSQCSLCDCGPYSMGCTYKSHDEKVCSCEAGYEQLDGECLECSCGSFGKCKFLGDGSKFCNCHYGYKDRNGICMRCDCGINGDCYFNEYGQETCNCNEGFADNNGDCKKCSCWLFDGSKYRDLNCTFRYGIQKCTCPEGYEEREEGNCADIDECKDLFICHPNAKCTNTPGSYTCTCKSGFRPFNEEGDPKDIFCIDINECEERNECPFRDTTECINTVGSYHCVCKDGYYSKFSSADIEIQGCKPDQKGWRIGYIILIVAFCVIAFGLIIAIRRRRSSSETSE